MDVSAKGEKVFDRGEKSVALGRGLKDLRNKKGG